jgi:DNA-binding MarR family transcriptional regulator
VAKSDKKAGKPAKADGKADHDALAAGSALEHSPSHLLHRALQAAVDLYAADAADGAITQRQHAVLAACAATTPAPSQSELVRLTGIDRSTLADMVARMITKGLLARDRSDTDARAKVVRLTEAGTAALEAAAPRVAQADARLMALLGPGKRAPFLAALGKLARAGDAPEPDTGDKPKKKAKGKDKDKARKKAKRAKAEATAKTEAAAEAAEAPAA